MSAPISSQAWAPCSQKLSEEKRTGCFWAVTDGQAGSRQAERAACASCQQPPFPWELSQASMGQGTLHQTFQLLMILRVWPPSFLSTGQWFLLNKNIPILNGVLFPLFPQKTYSIMQVEVTEDNPGMDKSVWTAQPTGANPADHPRFMISTTKSTTKATRDSYGKGHQEILEVTVLSIKKKASLNAGLDPNLQEDSLGLRSRNTLNYSGKSNLVFKVFPPQQGNSDVFLCDDLSETWELKHFVSSRPPQDGHTLSSPLLRTIHKTTWKKTSQGWSLQAEMQHKNRKSRCGTGLSDKPQPWTRAVSPLTIVCVISSPALHWPEIGGLQGKEPPVSAQRPWAHGLLLP